MKTPLLISSLLLAAGSVAAQVSVTPVSFSGKDPMRIVSKTVGKGLTAATTQIITQVPTGEVLTDLVWSARTCYPDNGKVTWTEVGGFVPSIVVSGSDMYIYAPITSLSEIAAAWIKGTISADGSTVTFPTPQAYMINEAVPGEVTTLFATRFTGDTGKLDENNLDIVFSYKDGELVQTDGGVLVLTDLKGNFYGYGASDMKALKIQDKPVEIPGNLDYTTYVMEYTASGNQRTKISSLIGEYGDNVYISDPLGIQNSWFLAVEDGDHFTVSTPQYMGSGSGYPLYLVTGKAFTRTETDPIGGTYEVTDYEVYPNTEIIFRLDPETGVYSTDQLLLLSSSKDKKGDATAPFMAPSYTPWTAVPVAPATPSVSFYFDLKEYEAMGLFGCMFTCEIPFESVEGGFIPQENLYYQVTFDGQPLEFYGATYIPFYAQFRDAAIQSAITVSGPSHQIQTPLKPSKSLGVQTFYEYEGQLIASGQALYDIVDGELQGLGIAEISDEDVQSVEFYDITGRRVSADHEGLIIRREHLRNGEIRTVKSINTLRK